MSLRRYTSNTGWFSRFNTTEDAIPLTDYASYIPGILMIGMIALVLVLDLFTELMADSQYYDFHNAFRVFDYISIAVGLMFLAYKGVKKDLTFCVRDAFFAGFIVCIIISTCINGLNHDAAFGMPIRYIGIFNMFAFFIIYMKVSGYIERIEFRYRILDGYMIVADAVALSALYEQYVGDIAAYQEKGGVCAVFANSNHYGYFICMAIAIGIGYFIYENGWRVYAGTATALLNLLILVLNNTLGAELAVGITVVMCAAVILFQDRDNKTRVRRVLIMAGFFLVGIIAVLLVSSETRQSVATLLTDMGNILTGNTTGHEGTGRIALWKTTLSYISKRPYFGYGCEGITNALLEDVGWGDAHCEVLTYAAYYGIPGALLYFGGITAAAVSYFKNRAKLPTYCHVAFMAASAYFLSSLGGVLMFYTAQFFFMFMGMAAEDYK